MCRVIIRYDPALALKNLTFWYNSFIFITYEKQPVNNLLQS